MEEQRRSHISEDIIIQEILPRVPAKSLCRFKCVSKRWYSVISHDLSFAQSHSQRFSSFSGILFHNLQETGLELRFISHDEKIFGIPEPSMRFLGEDVEIKASCKGLVCCRKRAHPENYYICNPVTKEWRQVPNPSQDHGQLTDVVLSFDPFIVPSSYKLVCILNSEDGFELEIFDSKADVWRIPRVNYTSQDDDGGDGILWHQLVSTICSFVSVRGIIYWLADPPIIISFDADGDTFRPLSLPDLTADERINQAWVTEFGGYLSYVNCVKSKGKVKTWILRNPSSNEWLLKYNIELPTLMKDIPEVWHTSNSRVNPYLWTLPCQDGEVLLLFLVTQNQLYAYHFKTRKLNRYPSLPLAFSAYYSYTNSLVRVPWR